MQTGQRRCMPAYPISKWMLFLILLISSDLTFNVDQTESAKSIARISSVRMEHVVLPMYNGAVCRNQYWMNDFSFLSGWLVVSSLKK